MLRGAFRVYPRLWMRVLGSVIRVHLRCINQGVSRAILFGVLGGEIRAYRRLFLSRRGLRAEMKGGNRTHPITTTSLSRSTHPTHSDYADNTPHALGKHHFPLSPSIPLMLPDHTALTALSSSIHYHRAVVCVHELLHKCQTHEHTPQQENSRWMVIGSSKQCDQGAREVSQEKGGNGVFHVHEEVLSA